MNEKENLKKKEIVENNGNFLKDSNPESHEENNNNNEIENWTESYRDGETKWELDRGRQGQRQRESIRERETVNLTATTQ